MTAQPLLEVRNLSKSFHGRRSGDAKVMKAVDDVSFDILPGETFGLVGESGCGKSTTGRALLRLIEPDSGIVSFQGQDLLKMPRKQLHSTRRQIQMVFQDPYSSLNPHRRVGAILDEALKIQYRLPRKQRTERVHRILDRVGFAEDYYYRFPHEMSGGQRQRIGVARALIVGPQLIICDEPVSALDVSIQSQVLNMLHDLQVELGLSYLFISHDLSVVRHISHRIAVMQKGRIVEQGSTDDIFSNPQHPYTRQLLDAIPASHPRLARERRAALTTPVT
ncbi:ABC transporter ATP-binding protein [Cryobacterium sp. TMT1-2-2]|uniref:ABC transporter ATP-binding protein n=1 Tax=Cryobacterium sp. TMT1-2-2 TaxID=1259233 RepID=UPI00106C4599|nr:ATP-binding cassette domain-containing protein [Cryobacterium sp. TMT1-2-2]TFD12252.1 ABC transporter ATP-binding protein [Cryobacterium sp. TMT1-2-2]